MRHLTLAVSPEQRPFVPTASARPTPPLAWAAAAVMSLCAAVGAQPAAEPPATAASSAFAVKVSVDTTRTRGKLEPIWRFFGTDEANYVYMKDGKRLLSDIAALDGEPKFMRAHGLFVTGDGKPALKWASTNVYTEDAQGNPVYDWTIVDRVMDTLIERKIKPYAQVGFMPEAMSTRPQPYKHNWKPGDKYDTIYTGWAYPPKDYDKWRELTFQWVKHCVERYGKAEVESWYWQIWNEPNIGYWKGTPQEFHKLYDYAVDGVRKALPAAKVGGPETAGGGGKFMEAFFEHCLRGTNYVTGKTGSPLDFVSSHAKGGPKFVEGRVQMGIASQIRDINATLTLMAKEPELKTKSLVIGESDPDGCAACGGPHYPQNGYRNTQLFASYTAASFARKHDLSERHGVKIDGALTWSFEFEDQPYFAGFRALATNGLTLPVFNTFRMFAMMNGDRVTAESTHQVSLDAMMKEGVRKEPDVAALAATAPGRLTVMVWHYHDDDIAGPAADVALSLAGLPAGKPVSLAHYRIDGNHSNAFAAWNEMGSPPSPTPEQYATLEKAAQLQQLSDPSSLKVEANGTSDVKFLLPRQGVSLLVLTW